MDQKKIDRINELFRKSKAEGLTDEEKQEQLFLRREYVDSVVGALRDNLDHTWIVNEHGNKRKLTPKGTRGRKERK